MQKSDLLENRLVDQLDFLHKLRGVGIQRLRDKYNRVFGKTRYYVTYTADIPREWIERRLFYAYCVKYPCYREGTKELIAFKRKAKQVFLEPPETQLTEAQQIREKSITRVLFTKRNVARMPEHEVDAYLHILGYDVEGTLPEKKQALWEAWNSKSADLPPVLNRWQKHKRIRRRGHNSDNAYCLVDVILKYPKMGWPEFQEVFGELMPSVTRGSFYITRTDIRKLYGPDVLPRLKAGGRRSNMPLSSWEGRVRAEKPDFKESKIMEIFQE